ncbi:MAG TPA: hypothetical protein VLH75_05305 [Longimicrobiales bacterium]|nr:hypothetical protein [Longimicrobiales bacterium]
MTAQAPSRVRALLGVLALGAGFTGCGDDTPIEPGDGPFGQVGSLEITVESPLALGAGLLTENLRWAATGEWSLEEKIFYRGLLGDGSSTRHGDDRAELALSYAGLINKLNNEPPQSLFVQELSPDLFPECGETLSRITLTIADEARDETKTWIRCAAGMLGTLTPAGAGPDAAAARVVLAAVLIRDATLGIRWTSAYHGSVPFGTLDRGGDSKSNLRAPATFIDAGGFTAFWVKHAPATAPPTVDFTKDMVVVGIVGSRPEAGDSVEVRRVLQVADGSLIHVVERLPGAYCSPAARTHVPYHVVVAPRTPIPHRFADIMLEPVSCGG